VTLWLLYFVYNEVKKPKNFPNGPFFYPLIGSIICLTKARKETKMLSTAITKIAKKYPNAKDVIGMKIGKDRVVFALSTKAFIEMYTNQDLDGRPKGPFYETRTWNLRRGLIFTDGGEYLKFTRFVIQSNKKEKSSTV
jgi:hypothetical protein